MVDDQRLDPLSLVAQDKRRHLCHADFPGAAWTGSETTGSMPGRRHDGDCNRTIMPAMLVAKDGKPWARLVPLDTDQPRRQPGPQRGQLQLPAIDVHLAPLAS
jgi:hypothetical protein